MKPWRAMDFHIEGTIRINNSETKYKMKSYAGARNCTDYRDIKVGDSVVMNIKENCSQNMKDLEL